MSLAELTFMSAAVYAGASQMVGIELFGGECSSLGDRRLDLGRELPARPLFGGDRPHIRHFTPSAEILHLFSCSSIRNLLKPSSVARPASP